MPKEEIVKGHREDEINDDIDRDLVNIMGEAWVLVSERKLAETGETMYIPNNDEMKKVIMERLQALEVHWQSRKSICNV